MAERRKLDRRNFSYYMRVVNDETGELVGHLTDISTGGFKLDCMKAVRPNTLFQLRIELTPEVASKEIMVFKAISRWCRADRFDPTAFNVGFQIAEMQPPDLEIFIRMFELYGTKSVQQKDAHDYLWH